MTISIEIAHSQRLSRQRRWQQILRRTKTTSLPVHHHNPTETEIRTLTAGLNPRSRNKVRLSITVNVRGGHFLNPLTDPQQMTGPQMPRAVAIHHPLLTTKEIPPEPSRKILHAIAIEIPRHESLTTPRSLRPWQRRHSAIND